jgi:phosphoribosylanthranilate isomerase
MAAEVKICGLSTPETMDAALGAGAAYVGLVFYRPSPRNVDLERARFLAERARGKAAIVTLIVDAEDELLTRIADVVRPDYFQAHGLESPERVAAIRRSTGVPVIKAIHIATPADLEVARTYREAAAMILFDAKAPAALEGALPGGNGLAFDWTLLSPDGTPRRFVLAGGLSPANVRHAIRATGAPIVDVSSGVESSPGVKDAGLIRKFIEEAEAAG